MARKWQIEVTFLRLLNSCLRSIKNSCHIFYSLSKNNQQSVPIISEIQNGEYILILIFLQGLRVLFQRLYIIMLHAFQLNQAFLKPDLEMSLFWSFFTFLCLGRLYFGVFQNIENYILYSLVPKHHFLMMASALSVCFTLVELSGHFHEHLNLLSCRGV